ncbi:MAG: AAA family ATPase [Acidimicrobiales bacterium]
MTGAGPVGALPTTMVETHVSLLFFIGDRVYKLRKPVQFGFADFRRREVRRTDCEREVALNRRLAPDVYLGVADLVFEGEPEDHMVVMRRLPERSRLATLAREGAPVDGCLGQVAEVMAAFHAGADRSPDIAAAASDVAIRSAWEDDFAETDPFVGPVLSVEVEEEIRSLVGRWVAGRTPLFEQRVDAGRVCDGHGDLQAEDIFCLDDGVRILDCIEFSDRLRHVDVCADVAFLAMDLERLGRPRSAVRFLAEYQAVTGDRFPDSLVDFYCASRAYIRAKVCCLRSAQGDPGARDEARHLQDLALRHLRQARVRLVVVGGLPGSGKSTVAAGIGAARNWDVLRSDELRHEWALLQVHPADTPGGDRYSEAATERVYGELLRRAERSLGLGRSMVLDASWTDARWRHAARTVADRVCSDLVELECRADPDVADGRILARSAEGMDPSEATPEVRAAMSRSADPWPTAWLIDTSVTTAEEAAGRALGALDAS